MLTVLSCQRRSSGNFSVCRAARRRGPLGVRISGRCKFHPARPRTGRPCDPSSALVLALCLGPCLLPGRRGLYHLFLACCLSFLQVRVNRTDYQYPRRPQPPRQPRPPRRRSLRPRPKPPRIHRPNHPTRGATYPAPVSYMGTVRLAPNTPGFL